jgi:hypothetical protein
VSVTVSVVPAAHVAAPVFSVCPQRSGATCSVGNLPVGQSDELQATVRVRRAAAVGEHVELSAKAVAKGADSSHSSATVVVTASPSPSPSPTSPVTTTPPAAALPPLPAVGALPPAPGSTAANPSGLFPTVSPQPSTNGGAGSATSAGRGAHRIKAVTEAATVPLDPRLIGGQLAGLAILAGAIVMAITRLSLRTGRPQADQQQGEEGPS